MFDSSRGSSWSSLSSASTKISPYPASHKYKTSIATTIFSSDTATLDRLRAISAAGFDGVEIGPADLEFDSESDVLAAARDVRAACDSLGLTVTIYQPLRDFEGQPTRERFQNKLAELERAFDIMEVLGTDLILLCSNCQADALDDQSQYVKDFRVACDRAAARGMRLVYEALSWGTHVATLDRLWDIVKCVDRKNFGIMLDTFHILARNCPLDPISEMGCKVFFVQFSDAPVKRGVRDYLGYSRHSRALPFQGEFPLVDLVQRVDALNFVDTCEYLSLEAFDGGYKRENAAPDTVAVDAMVSLQRLQLLAFQQDAADGFVVTGVDKGVVDDAVNNVNPADLLEVGYSDLEQLVFHANHPTEYHRYLCELGLTGAVAAAAATAVATAAATPAVVHRSLRVTCSSDLEFSRALLYLQAWANLAAVETKRDADESPTEIVLRGLSPASCKSLEVVVCRDGSL